MFLSLQGQVGPGRQLQNSPSWTEDSSTRVLDKIRGMWITWGRDTKPDIVRNDSEEDIASSEKA